jgi:chemotaxis protein CheX
MDVSYINPFIQAVDKVFQSMVKIPATQGKLYVKTADQDLSRVFDVAAAIDITGTTSGRVTLRFHRAVAFAIVAGLTGSPKKKELDDECFDALGELANMVVGSAKQDLPGGQCGISTPRVTCNDNLEDSGLGPVLVIPFDSGCGRFIVEVQLKTRQIVAATAA